MKFSDPTYTHHLQIFKSLEAELSQDRTSSKKQTNLILVPVHYINSQAHEDDDEELRISIVLS